MGYYTKNEIQHFAFTQAHIFDIKEYRSQLIFELGYVIIKAENSCNRDVFDMGTNELRLRLYDVTDVSLTRLGYKEYDANGRLMSETPDETVKKEEQQAVLEGFQGGAGQITNLEVKDGTYCFDVETEEELYLLEVCATDNSQEWERFRRLPQ